MSVVGVHRHWRQIVFQHGSQLGLPAPGHVFLDSGFVALLSGLIEHLAQQVVGQVLLGDPMVPIGVGIQVTPTVAEILRIATGVFQMAGHFPFLLFLHGANGVEEGKGTVALGSGGQVETSLCQVKPPFRHTHVVEGLGAPGHHPNGVGVGHAHVFTSQDEHAAENEARIFAGIQHACHPVQSRVGIGAAQTLDEGTDGVEVSVAILVVQDSTALD